jgi:hypothetical protein
LHLSLLLVQRLSEKTHREDRDIYLDIER